MTRRVQRLRATLGVVREGAPAPKRQNRTHRQLARQPGFPRGCRMVVESVAVSRDVRRTPGSAAKPASTRCQRGLCPLHPVVLRLLPPVRPTGPQARPLLSATMLTPKLPRLACHTTPPSLLHATLGGLARHTGKSTHVREAHQKPLVTEGSLGVTTRWQARHDPWPTPTFLNDGVQGA